MTFFSQISLKIMSVARTENIKEQLKTNIFRPLKNFFEQTLVDSGFCLKALFSNA
jgi:hypothetical protein